MVFHIEKLKLMDSTPTHILNNSKIIKMKIWKLLELPLLNLVEFQKEILTQSILIKGKARRKSTDLGILASESPQMWHQEKI